MTRNTARSVTVIGLDTLPEITTGSDLGALLAASLARVGGLRDGDVLVVSSKVVSKALGLRVASGAAREDLVARHTRRVVAERTTAHGTTQIVEAVAGPVMAAAGLDASNTGPGGGVLVLPEDPDAAAADLHAQVARHAAGVRFGLLLSDTAGRPWREGQTDLALGAHGLQLLDDLRGGQDSDGRPLAVTARAVGDELAAAADLVKGKVGGTAAAVVRGLPEVIVDGSAGEGARSLVRTGPGDWFALGHREAVRAALGAEPGTPQAREVGIPSVAAEPDGTRAERAVRLALLGHEAEVSGSTAQGYVVSAARPWIAGRVAARLEIALAGEGLVEVAVRTAEEE